MAKVENFIYTKVLKGFKSHPCNFTNDQVSILYDNSFLQPPLTNPSTDMIHFTMIVCTLGPLEGLGVILNFLTIAVFCRDKKYRGSVTFLLQFIACLDILYLATHFASTFLPAFFQFIQYNGRSCHLAEYPEIRIQNDKFYSVALGVARDCVVWYMILISEYCLLPYCCPGQTTKKLYNLCFAVCETVIILGFVGGINTFLFMCRTKMIEGTLAGWYPLVEMFNVFLPLGCIFVMYVGVAIQMGVERFQQTDPWMDHGMTHLYRTFSIITLFLLCEVPFLLYWILRWRLVMVVDARGYFIISYTALIAKHVNSSFKFVMYLMAGSKFRQALRRTCCGELDPDDIEPSAMTPVLPYEDVDNYPQEGSNSKSRLLHGGVELDDSPGHRGYNEVSEV